MAPTRRPGEPPLLTIEVAPAYEFLMSVVTAFDTADADTYEIGPDWIEEVRRRAGEDLLRRAAAVAQEDSDTWIHLIGLVYDSPAPRDVSSFLEHLRRTDADEIRLHLVQFYARDTRRMTSPTVIRSAVSGDPEAQRQFLRTSHPDYEPWTAYLRGILEADGEELKRELIAVLEEWAERVWNSESLTILPILERDAEAKRELLRALPLDRFFETATNGVEYVPRPGIDRVVMIPSMVNRPLVVFGEFGEVMIVVYPVADESVSADSDAPPLRLVRLSKALGDEKRLRILRTLAEGEKSLMDLADAFGVAKTTMHHHMIVLRSAGLVSVAVGSKCYRLRREMVPDVGELLSGYLGAVTGPSAASRPPAPSRRKHRTGTEG
ncbi:MAG: ArsR/SmtB family transcription factor [Candidatus Limnocylindria bacterium]